MRNPLLDQFANWIELNKIDTLATIVGVIISLVGFTWTIINVTRAREAAIDAKNTLRLYDTVADVAQAISMMDEIKNLNRLKKWEIALERYSSLKKLLIEIKSTNSGLEDERKKDLQKAIQNLANIEDGIEQWLENSAPAQSVAKLNKIISQQIGSLHILLIEIKNEDNR